MRIAFVVFCTLFLISAIAQKEIKIEDAKDYIGDSAKLSGKAYGVRYLENFRNNHAFINLGTAYSGKEKTTSQ